MFHAVIHELGRSGAFAARMAAAWVFPLGLLLVGAEGADRLGIAPTMVFSLGAFREGLQSPALVSVIIGALCVPLTLAAIRTRRLSIAVVAMIGAAIAIAASGHAWSAGHWSAVPLTALHAGMVMFWVGGLFPLAMAMKDASGTERAGILRRFSRLALPTVILLMAAGSGLVLLRKPTLTMIATPWGALLSAKLVIVAMMLMLALWHRQSATPKLAARADAPIARSIWLEAGLGICVIFLAMGFRLAPPPSKSDSLPPLLHLHGEKVMVGLQADAFAPGQVGFAISLSDHAFGPIDPLDVTLSFSDPATGVGPLDVTARRLSLGAWQAPPLTLPSAGPWTVRVTILVSDFESTWLEGQFPSPVGNGD
jgi:copper transport protein